MLAALVQPSKADIVPHSYQFHINIAQAMDEDLHVLSKLNMQPLSMFGNLSSKKNHKSLNKSSKIFARVPLENGVRCGALQHVESSVTTLGSNTFGNPHYNHPYYICVIAIHSSIFFESLSTMAKAAKALHLPITPSLVLGQKSNFNGITCWYDWYQSHQSWVRPLCFTQIKLEVNVVIRAKGF